MAFERLGLGAILDFDAGAAVVNMKTASAAAESLQKGLTRIGVGARKISSGVRQIGMTAAVTAAPALLGVAGATGTAVKKFAEFDDSLAVVRTIFPGTEAELQKLGGTLQELGVEFGKRSPEVLASAYESLSASVPQDELEAFTKLAGQAAVGGLTDMKTSVDVLTTTVNTYGAALGANATYTERAQKASDLLLKTQELGKTTLGAMGRAMGFVLPVAQSFGVGLEDVSAAMATMTASGIRTSTAATSLRQVLATIAKPTDEAIKAAKKLGIKLGPAALQTKGLSGVMAELIEKSGGSTAALTKIFGPVEAFNAAAKLAAQGGEAFTQNLAKMQDVTGTTEATFAKRSDSLKFQAQRVFAAIGVAAERSGTAIVQEFGLKGIGGLADLIMAKMPQIVATASSFAAGVRAGFEGMRASLETFRPQIEAIAAHFGLTGLTAGSLAGKIGELVGKFGALLPVGLGAMLVLKPMMGVLGGVAQIGSGLITVLGGLRGAIGALSTLAGGGLLPILLLAGTLIAALVTDSGGLQGVMALLGDTFRELMGALEPVIRALIDHLGPIIRQIVDMAGQILAPILRTLSSLFETLTPILRTVGEIFSTIFGVLSPITELLNGAFLTALKIISEVLEYTLKPILELIKWLFEMLLKAASALTDAMDVLFNSITGNSAGVEKAINRMANAAADAAGEAQTAATAYGITRGKRAEKGEGVAAARAEQLERIAVGERMAAAGFAEEIEAAVARGTEAGQKKRRDCIDLKTGVKVDGRDLTVAESRAKLELTERAGAGVTPWQKRAVSATGAAFARASRG